MEKNGKPGVGRSRSFAFLKQQVVVDVVYHWSRTHARRLVGVETPAISLPFLNCFTDLIMVPNLHTFPFLQRIFTFLALYYELFYKKNSDIFLLVD